MRVTETMAIRIITTMLMMIAMITALVTENPEASDCGSVECVAINFESGSIDGEVWHGISRGREQVFGPRGVIIEITAPSTCSCTHLCNFECPCMKTFLPVCYSNVESHFLCTSLYYFPVFDIHCHSHIYSILHFHYNDIDYYLNNNTLVA